MKNTYQTPVTMVNHAEPQTMMAVSLDRASVEWKEGITLETKEDNQWEDIWQ